jgi:putative hemolysin
LAQGGHLETTLFVPPRPGFECELHESGAENVEAAVGEPMQIPKLFRSYLRFGAKVCGPPALDRQFKTIDFFILFDVEALGERARQLLCAPVR